MYYIILYILVQNYRFYNMPPHDNVLEAYLFNWNLILIKTFKMHPCNKPSSELTLLLLNIHVSCDRCFVFNRSQMQLFNGGKG